MNINSILKKASSVIISALKPKRLTAVALTMLILIGSFPLSADAAVIDSKQSEGLEKYGDVISNDEPGEIVSYSGYITKNELAKINSNASLVSTGASITPSFDVCTDANGYTITVQKSMASHVRGEDALMIKIEGKRAYCIQPGEPLNTGSNMATTSDIYNALKPEQQQAIKAILCYGLEGNATAIRNSGSISIGEAYCATQVIVWEIVKGERSAFFPYKLNSGKGGYIDMYCAGGKNPNIRACYNNILKYIATFQTVPSMMSAYKFDANTITLNAKYNYNKTTGKGSWVYDTRTLSDSNKVMGQFYKSGYSRSFNITTSNGTAKVNVAVTGNNMTLKVESATVKSTSSSSSATGTYANPIAAEKTGIPTSATATDLIGYGSSTYQDVVCGGKVDPPSAYFRLAVKLDVNITENPLTRDGRVQKVCLTRSEEKNGVVGGGLMSTTETLKGWYFYVKVPTEFKSKYGKDHIILGPTDENGFTQTISDYIIKNIDKYHTYNVPKGTYEVYELGRLKSGASGTNLNDDYYFPNNIYSQKTDYKEYLRGDTSSGINQLIINNESHNNLCYANNVFVIPLKIRKTAQDNGSVSNYYFKAHKNGTNINLTLGPTDVNGYIDASLDDGIWTITELGKADNPFGPFEIPSQYDTPSAQEVEISADEYKAYTEILGLDAILISFVNTCSRYIAVQKTDSETAAALSGAVYGIFSDAACLNCIESLTTDANGYAQSKHPYATDTRYYIKEVTPPTGYTIDETIYTIDLTPSSTQKIFVRDISDDKIKGNVKGRKVDEDGNGLSGAVIGLFSDTATSYTTATALKTSTTDSNGYYSFNGIEYGKYKIKELTAPVGYIVSPTVYTATISRNGQTVNIANIVNTKVKGNIDGYKVDESGNGLSGAVIGLFSSTTTSYTTATAVKTFTTGSNGYYKFTDLEYGTYKVRELKPPSGYIINTSVYTASITKNGQTVRVANIVNKKGKGNIDGYKVDANGSGLSGAVIGLFSDTATSYTTATALKTCTTNTTGYFIFTGVESGTYKVAELKAPDGYVLSDKISTVTISENGQTVRIPNIVNSAKGLIYGYKTTFYNNASHTLQGVTIGLYTDSAATDCIATTVSDSDGYFEFPNLDYNTYYVKEIKGVEGYVVSEKIYSRTVSADKPTAVKVAINNIKIFGSIDGYKIDESGNGLKNVGIGLFSDSSAKKQITVSWTDSKGYYKFSNIEYGVYYIKEVARLQGYVLNNTIYKVTISESGQTVTVPNIINAKIRGNIHGYKVDESGNTLAGAVIGLFSNDTTTYTTATALKTFTTDSKGYYKFSDVEYGTYKIAEISAPTGYVLSNNVYAVNVSSDGETITLEDIVNTKIRGSIDGYKVDENGKGLANAVIGLFSENTPNYTASAAIKTCRTDSNGYFKFTDIEYGSYKIREITAPTGYALDSTVFTAVISEDGKTVRVNNIVNIKITGNIKLIKKDSETGSTLSGVEFNMFNSAGELMYFAKNQNGEYALTDKNGVSSLVTDNAGIILITKLIPGNYKIQEIKTNSSYNLLKRDIDVSIEGFKTTELTIKNSKTEQYPNAGATELLLLGSSGLLSIGIGFILIRKKRRITL